MRKKKRYKTSTECTSAFDEHKYLTTLGKPFSEA